MTSVRLLSSQRFVLALALSPILLVALLLRAEEVGAAHLKDYQTQATYQAFPRAVGDPWDLSYSYSERAKYELRSGDMRAADADFQRAYDLYRQNSWTRLTLSDLERIPNRVDWQFANGVNLVGYTPEDTAGTVGSPLRFVLYWSVRTEPPAAFDVQILIKDIHGQTLGETTTTPTQAQYSVQDWKVRDVVREIYVIPYTTPPLSTESVSLNLNLVDPATHRSWPIINQGGNTSNILVNVKILR